MPEEQIKQLIRDELSHIIRDDRFVFNRLIQIMDGRNIQLGKTTGTKLGTETSQKLGFFGKTPVIQQTASSQSPASFVANTSGISDDTATWGGYTVGDIVAILKVFGLIS